MKYTNDYSTLELDIDATYDDLTESYRKLAMMHHPDRGGNEEEFKKISVAYSNLSRELAVCNKNYDTKEIKKDQEEKKFYTIDLVNVEGKMFHYVKFRKDVEYEMSFVMKLDSGELLGEEPKAFGSDGIVRNDPGLFEMVRKECIDIMKDYHYQLGEKLKRL